MPCSSAKKYRLTDLDEVDFVMDLPSVFPCRDLDRCILSRIIHRFACRFTAAEADCNKCLKLDVSYIKAYLRRATARVNLDKSDLALKDYQKVSR